MTLLQYIAVYATSVPIFFAIDMLWLGIIAAPVYQSKLGYLLGPIQWPVAIAFYLLFLIGLLIFAIAPALEAESIMKALVLGALFGFFTYATYDLTNWATIRDWPALIVFIDIAWGTFLAGAVSVSTYSIVRFVFHIV